MHVFLCVFVIAIRYIFVCMTSRDISRCAFRATVNLFTYHIVAFFSMSMYLKVFVACIIRYWWKSQLCCLHRSKYAPRIICMVRDLSCLFVVLCRSVLPKSSRIASRALYDYFISTDVILKNTGPLQTGDRILVNKVQPNLGYIFNSRTVDYKPEHMVVIIHILCDIGRSFLYSFLATYLCSRIPLTIWNKRSADILFKLVSL